MGVREQSWHRSSGQGHGRPKGWRVNPNRCRRSCGEFHPQEAVQSTPASGVPPQAPGSPGSETRAGRGGAGGSAAEPAAWPTAQDLEGASLSSVPETYRGRAHDAPSCWPWGCRGPRAAEESGVGEARVFRRVTAGGRPGCRGRPQRGPSPRPPPPSPWDSQSRPCPTMPFRSPEPDSRSAKAVPSGLPDTRFPVGSGGREDSGAANQGHSPPKAAAADAGSHTPSAPWAEGTSAGRWP